MGTVLLELFSEEIPARLQDGARAELARRLGEGLAEAGFDRPEIRTYATPRRLVALIDDLPERQPDRREERKGPKVGAPDKAVQGFLSSVGLTLDQVETRETDKGATYFAVIETEGRPSADVLGDLVAATVSQFHWPRSMRWGTGALRWVRPLHNILCLFDGEPVPVAVEGVTARPQTRGHRFMAPDAFPVRETPAYWSALEDAKVMLDQDRRRAKIDTDARALAQKSGLELVEDPGLLAEVTGLVEWPVVLMGRFDDAFLRLPDEVLISAKRGHQKYFSLRNPKTGQLAPHFITVANLEAADGGRRIIEGNERVLRARLSDACFFWDQDRKRPLAERAEGLKDVVFHAQLGTLADKVARLSTLAAHIAPLVGANPDDARQAADLAKCDLLTGMVGEFPELQGLMGRYYALGDGLCEAVADAIFDHYAPQGPHDRCPDKPVSMAVALADKIDTLTGFWLIGETPTGSKDPFALRRAALGVVRIALENDLRLPLSDLFDASAAAYGDLGKGKDAARADLLGFVAERLKGHLRDRKRRHDLIDAVFTLPGQDDVVSVVRRVEALTAFLATEDGANLQAGVKRASNILRIEEKKDGKTYAGTADPSGLTQAEEKTLFEMLGEAEQAAANAIAAEDFAGAMAALAPLRTPVDAFFEKVTVNAPEADIRHNRLLLLSQIRASVSGVADFSRIEG
ncbi:MAG: glycine--tRNA ligase subunit beta [Alphaproteobacteria bacterium]